MTIEDQRRYAFVVIESGGNEHVECIIQDQPNGKPKSLLCGLRNRWVPFTLRGPYEIEEAWEKMGHYGCHSCFLELGQRFRAHKAAAAITHEGDVGGHHVALLREYLNRLAPHDGIATALRGLDLEHEDYRVVLAYQVMRGQERCESCEQRAQWLLEARDGLHAVCAAHEHMVRVGVYVIGPGMAFFEPATSNEEESE